MLRQTRTEFNEHAHILLAYSNYCDPCTDYLNNPMFESLQARRYWAPDKTITLRPFGSKKQAYKAINVKSACKVL